MKNTKYTEAPALEETGLYGYINNSDVFKDIQITTHCMVLDTYKEDIRRTVANAFEAPYYVHHDYITEDDLCTGTSEVTKEQRKSAEVSIKKVKKERLLTARDMTCECLKLLSLSGVIYSQGTETDAYEIHGLNREDYTVDILSLEGDALKKELEVLEKYLKCEVSSFVKVKTGEVNDTLTVNFVVTEAVMAHLKKESNLRAEYAKSVNTQTTESVQYQLRKFFNFGVSDYFQFGNLKFLCYDPKFPNSDGNLVSAYRGNGFIFTTYDDKDFNPYKTYWAKTLDDIPNCLSNIGGQMSEAITDNKDGTEVTTLGVNFSAISVINPKFVRQIK